MKALLFHQQLEIRLEVTGEEFHQGDSIACALSIKNRHSAPQRVEGPVLELAQGEMKKVKQKAADAFTVLAAAEKSAGKELAPGEEQRTEWQFTLDKNCPITDTAQSLFVVYGVEGPVPGRNHLQLLVRPHADIEGILGVFETSFQFVHKGSKAKSGAVQARLKPPVGKEFFSVEELQLTCRFKDDLLLLNYLFKVKKLEAGPTTLNVQKKKVEFAQELPRSSYFSPAGFVDSRLLEPHIEEAISTVRSKFIR